MGEGSAADSLRTEHTQEVQGEAGEPGPAPPRAWMERPLHGPRGRGCLGHTGARFSHRCPGRDKL